MEGVNILTTVVVEELTGWFIAFLMVGIALLVTGVKCGFEFGFAISNYAGIFLGVLCLIACCSPISISSTTQYKATIEDTVVFSELMEKYEIVEQQDDLYTLELREE